MLLYPQLPHTVAIELAREVASIDIREAQKAARTTHPMAIYTATGGNRVDTPRLERLQADLQEAATLFGYPGRAGNSQLTAFDTAAARILLDGMDTSPAEACREGIWAFLASVMVPHLVRWRFPGQGGLTSGSGTTIERFVGGNRGLRNTFGRLWWRGYLLREDLTEHPYRYLEELGEDELVQITERPNLAGNASLARHVCSVFLERTHESRRTARTELLREAMKRLRRLLPVTSFETLDTLELRALLSTIFCAAESALGIATGDVVPDFEVKPEVPSVHIADDNGFGRTGDGQGETDTVLDTLGKPRNIGDALQQVGIWHITDRRRTGGRLWILGGAELYPQIMMLSHHGYEFRFTERGGRATNYQPGWYML